MSAERARDAAGLLRETAADYEARAQRCRADGHEGTADAHDERATRLRALAETLGRVTGEDVLTLRQGVSLMGAWAPGDDLSYGERRLLALADTLAALAGGTTEGR